MFDAVNIFFSKAKDVMENLFSLRFLYPNNLFLIWIFFLSTFTLHEYILTQLKCEIQHPNSRPFYVVTDICVPNNYVLEMGTTILGCLLLMCFSFTFRWSWYFDWRQTGSKDWKQTHLQAESSTTVPWRGCRFMTHSPLPCLSTHSFASEERTGPRGVWILDNSLISCHMLEVHMSHQIQGGSNCKLLHRFMYHQENILPIKLWQSYFPSTYSKIYLALLRQILTYLKHAQRAKHAQDSYILRISSHLKESNSSDSLFTSVLN